MMGNGYTFLQMVLSLVVGFLLYPIVTSIAAKYYFAALRKRDPGAASQVARVNLFIRMKRFYEYHRTIAPLHDIYPLVTALNDEAIDNVIREAKLDGSINTIMPLPVNRNLTCLSLQIQREGRAGGAHLNLFDCIATVATNAIPLREQKKTCDLEDCEELASIWSLDCTDCGPLCTGGKSTCKPKVYCSEHHARTATTRAAPGSQLFALQEGHLHSTVHVENHQYFLTTSSPVKADMHKIILRTPEVSDGLPVEALLWIILDFLGKHSDLSQVGRSLVEALSQLRFYAGEG